MDDLRLFSKNSIEKRNLIQIVYSFSNDIGMRTELEKCASVTHTRDKLNSTGIIGLDTDTAIRELDRNHSYKYLGIDETSKIQHIGVKEKIRKEYFRRV